MCVGGAQEDINLDRCSGSKAALPLQPFFRFLILRHMGHTLSPKRPCRKPRPCISCIEPPKQADRLLLVHHLKGSAGTDSVGGGGLGEELGFGLRF